MASPDKQGKQKEDKEKAKAEKKITGLKILERYHAKARKVIANNQSEIMAEEGEQEETLEERNKKRHLRKRKRTKIP